MSRVRLIALTASFLCSVTANAADVTWGGVYRAEAVKIGNPELSSKNTDKSYLLHHLVLNPKLVASDGITIYGRFDILNNPVFGINSNGQVQSVAGDALGNGPGDSPMTPGSAATRGTDSNAYGTTQRAGGIAVTEMYMSWAQEFGQLVVGRAPLQFGLGTAYSAGNGPFDHYITTRDMVGYKMVLGNLFIMPIKAKVSSGSFNTQNDVDDYIVHVQYDNPDTELSLGLFHDVRVVTGNDVPTTGYFGGASPTRTGSYRNTLTSLFFSQKANDWLRATVEADLYSGDSGLTTSTGAGVGINAWGLAGELAIINTTPSKWDKTLKFGFATGDDPGTVDTYEGYAFHRNYDVAMLMFNHPLGQTDLLRTGWVRDTSAPASNQIDTEAISNAMYLAPTFLYRSSDNLAYGLTFIYGRLNKDPNGPNSGTSMTLGYEFDFSIQYKPAQRVTWTTEFGALWPGDAWKGSTTQNFETKFPYGITTKAAINF